MSGHILSFLLWLIQEGQLSVTGKSTLYVHEVLVNRLGGLSLPRKSVVRLIDRPHMTLDVYLGRKTTIQQQQLAMNLLCQQQKHSESRSVMAVNRHRGYKTSLSMKFFLLINVKMPTIVGILTFMNRKNSILGLTEPEKC